MNKETFKIRGGSYTVEYECGNFDKDMEPRDYVSFYELSGDFISGDWDGTNEILDEIAREIFNTASYAHCDDTTYKHCNND